MEPIVSPSGEASLAADKIAWVVLFLWAAAVLAYGAYRSRGEAKPDPIRPPGPILRTRSSSGRGGGGEAEAPPEKS